MTEDTPDILYNMVSQGLNARECQLLDLYWVWNARNSPKVRQASLDPSPITLREHLFWMIDMKFSSRKFCWVISLNSKPVFVIQASNSDGTVRWGGYGVELESLPIGLGAVLPVLGIRLVSSLPKVSRIRIEVKQENAGTARRYEEWGFLPRVETMPTLHKIFEMSLEEAQNFATDYSLLLPSQIQDLSDGFQIPKITDQHSSLNKLCQIVRPLGKR